MGTLIAVYSERKGKFFPCANKVQLKTEGVRRILGSPLRYCLGSDYLYVPAHNDELSEQDRLCWVRDREFHDFDALNKAAEEGFDFSKSEVRIGNTYVKRRRELDGKFLEVESFVAKELYESLAQNSDGISQLSKDDFESLCAELFVKRGFEVDLFRRSGDGGIDFLAVKNDDLETSIFAAQCKQPDERVGKAKRSLGRPVLQQIYGAAKAWDLSGAIAISGSTYSPQAARFAENKPSEMLLHDASDLSEWIQKYRWNEDE